MTSITLYGGAGELGGTKLLLEDNGTRLLVDFGVNFDRFSKYFSFPRYPKKFEALKMLTELGVLPDIEGVYRPDHLRQMGREPGNRAVDAMILSHAHLDHALYINWLRPDIDIWMDKYTKRILYVLEHTSGGWDHEFLSFSYAFAWGDKPRQELPSRLQGSHVTLPRPIKLFEPPKPFRVGSIEIEPFYVDHSLPGSCAFIIHTSVGPIVYTGDLRLRGRRRQDTEEFVRRAKACKPAYLLCEGSLIDKKHVGSEDEVVDAICDFVEGKQLVVAAYPPRDLDRIESFYRAAKRSGRRLVLDARQAFLLDLFGGELGYPKTTWKNIGIHMPPKAGGAIDGALPQEVWDKDYFKWERRFLKHPNRVTAREIHDNPSDYMLYLQLAGMSEMVEFEPPPGSAYLRSHPEPYTEEMELGEQVLLNWLNRYHMLQKEDGVTEKWGEHNVQQVHVTGHMSAEETAWLINQIAPTVLVPIHTLYPQMFRDFYRGEVRVPEHGKTMQL